MKDLTRQLSMDQVCSISIKVLGLSPTLKQIGELVIELHDGKQLTLLRGRDVRELAWIQRVIFDASGYERPTLEGFPA